MSLSELAIPGSVQRQQSLFLYAISVSVEMAQISYGRLQTALVIENSVDRTALALLDAWALVDTLNRLRVLVAATPGLRRNSPGTQSIQRALAPVEELRNAVQHMYGEIDRLRATNEPLWGTIAWVQRGPEDHRIRSRSLLAGVQPQDMNVPIVTPVGKQIESPAGPIELTAAGRTISLSRLVAASVRFGDRLARAAQLTISEMPPGARDHRLVLDVQAS